MSASLLAVLVRAAGRLYFAVRGVWSCQGWVCWRGVAWPDTAAALFPVLEAAAANELRLVVGRLNLLSVFNKKIIVTPCEISSRTTYVISG